MKTGAQLIAEERERQISQEGWTPENDDQFKHRELARGAQSYLNHYVARSWVLSNEFNLPGVKAISYTKEKAPDTWPWRKKWWKPKGKIRDLVRIGALVAAEIDRLQRDESNAERSGGTSAAVTG